MLTITLSGRSPAAPRSRIQRRIVDGCTAKLGQTRRSTGTSNAAALATRTGILLADVLDDALEDDDVEWYKQDTAPCVLKALIAHGATWGDVGDHMAEICPPAGKKLRQKDTVARFLGYGRVEPDRVILGDQSRVTLLGRDLIKKDKKHCYKIPLPDELSSQAEFRRITVTLAWLTPVRANSANYRSVGLEIVNGQGRSHLWQGAKRRSGQPSVDASKKGTLIHAVYEGQNPVPFIQGSDFEINVQATSRLTGVSAFEIPYALAVTIEVAATLQADINQTIRNRIKPQVPIR